MLRPASWIVLLVLGGCGGTVAGPDAGTDAARHDAALDAPDTLPDARGDADDGGPPDGGGPIALVLEGDPDDVASATSETDLVAGGRARFSIAVPEGGRYVLYAAAGFSSDDGVLGASIELVDPVGARVVRVTETEPAGGRALRLARLLAVGGEHEIVLEAGAAGAQVVLEVRLYAEADPTESAPMRVTLTGAETHTLTIGRVNHQEDVDLAEVIVPPSSSPRSLHVRVAADLGGRFEPIAGHRILRVTRPLEPGSCARACPIDTTAEPSLVSEASARCSADECLLARRAERSALPTLEGLEAIVPLPPAAASTSVRIAVSAEGSAADAPVTATVLLADDPDEASRYAGGAVEQPTMVSQAIDASGDTYPAPPLSATVLAGTLVTGHGDTGGAVRRPGDYDAQPSDVDVYVSSLPVDTTLGAWELAWEIEHVDGAAPAELAIDVVLCDGDAPSTSGCTPVEATASGQPLRFVYQAGASAAWFDDGTPAAWVPRWDRTVSPTSTTITVGAAQCSCLEDRFVRGGRLELRVRLGARAAWDPVTYSVRTAVTTYPRGYADASGAPRTCPTPCASTAW